MENFENYISKDEIKNMKIVDLKDIEAMHLYSINSAAYSLLKSFSYIKDLRSFFYLPNMGREEVVVYDLAYNYSPKEFYSNLKDILADCEWMNKELVDIQSDFFSTSERSGAVQLFGGSDIINVKNEYDKFVLMIDKYINMLKQSIESMKSVIREKRENIFIEKMLNINNQLKDALKEFVDSSFNFKGASDIYSGLALLENIHDNQYNYTSYVLKNADIPNYKTKDETLEKTTEIAATKALDEEYKKLKRAEEEKRLSDMAKAEEERLRYIDKANDLYNRLCNDFMRDLEKQVPYSAKKAYDDFIKTFEGFKDLYGMPLSKGASLKDAKTCCNQINDFFDMISKISEQSYSITPVQRGE